MNVSCSVRHPLTGNGELYLLLDLEDFPLELALNLCVLGLDSLQSLDSPLDGRGQRLEVSGRLANERSQSVLHHVEQSGVL